MEEPVIAGRRSAKVVLQPGSYYWCACGRSKHQPFCDGSHRGSSFTPVLFEVTEEKRCSLCLCKLTKTPPYCDHTHRTLPPENTGTEPRTKAGETGAAEAQPKGEQ
jgi:CDGSH-type Zn-finger protein